MLASITSVTANATNSLSEIVVTFDLPVDGSLLDADWLTDDSSSDVTTGLVDQTSPTSAVFGVGFAAWNNGDTWSITRAQAGLDFPQSGSVA